MNFLRKIADVTPLPAGGAASAYVSCLAIGLIQKIVLFGIYRHANRPTVEKKLLTIKKELEQLLKDCYLNRLIALQKEYHDKYLEVMSKII